MLWTLAFDAVGVAVADIYFLDPNLEGGDGEAERGVRLELRRFERDDLRGSVYSGVPIRVDRPIWRVDLLETVSSEPGSLDRAHHHPRFDGWEPGRRVFVEALSADPVRWLTERFAAIDDVLEDAGATGSVSPADVEALRAAGPMVMAHVGHALGEVAAGRAGLAPQTDDDFVRASWL